MASIKTDYDLSGGSVLSDEVSTPNNWRVSATVTDGLPRQRVKCILEVEDELGNWDTIRDDMGRVISFMIIGNDTVSINPIVVNGANGRVRIVPKGNAEGTINVDSINS
jgi:hypothetical protein